MGRDATVHSFHLSSPGPRPPFYAVAEHLWGPGCDIDSDGNSSSRDATDWTELTIELRSAVGQRVDVDPVGDGDLFALKITSEDRDLARRAALFLQTMSGGELSEETIL